MTRSPQYKSKTLYINGQDGVVIHVQCRVSEYTGRVGVYGSFYRSLNWNNGSHTDPSCSAFFGCHVAEQVLAKVFKNVTQMPYGNKGFDFICGKGYRVDVKASCFVKSRREMWHFNIDKNTSADYFLCIGFDNRKDINPLRMWMVPGNVVNHLDGVSISETALGKWKSYELPIDKTMRCCDDMKQNYKK